MRQGKSKLIYFKVRKKGKATWLVVNKELGLGPIVGSNNSDFNIVSVINDSQTLVDTFNYYFSNTVNNLYILK